MARPHLPALGIEEPTGERARGACRAWQASAPPVGGQLVLHRLPERRLHDRGVLAGMDLVPVPDAADEERVGEQGVEPAAGEGGAAAAASTPMQPFRAAEAGGIELGLELADRAERKVAREDSPHQERFLRHRLQAARRGAIADRHRAAHPDAFRLGGGDLVADPLGGHLSLELGEGEQDVQRQSSHRGGGVERLRHRHEGDPGGVEDGDDAGEVGERPGQPIDLVDDHRTEDRPPPPPLAPGDRLTLGPLRACVERLLDHPRLIALRFIGNRYTVLAGLARHGRPIQYAHVPEPLLLEDVWTRIAADPVAFEPPSAGFALDWATLAGWRRRGIGFATLSHAAGISSTGDPDSTPACRSTSPIAFRAAPPPP